MFVPHWSSGVRSDLNNAPCHNYYVAPLQIGATITEHNGIIVYYVESRKTVDFDTLEAAKAAVEKRLSYAVRFWDKKNKE